MMGGRPVASSLISSRARPQRLRGAHPDAEQVKQRQFGPWRLGRYWPLTCAADVVIFQQLADQLRFRHVLWLVGAEAFNPAPGAGPR